MLHIKKILLVKCFHDRQRGQVQKILSGQVLSEPDGRTRAYWGFRANIAGVSGVEPASGVRCKGCW